MYICIFSCFNGTKSLQMSTARCRQSFLHHYRFSIQSNSFYQHSCFVDFNEILPSAPQLLISAAGANSQKGELKSCVLCSQECLWSGDCSHPVPVLITNYPCLITADQSWRQQIEFLNLIIDTPENFINILLCIIPQ